MPHEYFPPTDPYELTPILPGSEHYDRYVLPEGGKVEVDLEHPLLGREAVHNDTGFDAAKVAKIQAGRTEFDLYDTRSSDVTKPFLLVWADEKSHIGYVDIPMGETVIVGRKTYKDWFVGQDSELDKKMSNEHFAITVDLQTGALTIADLHSLNGTVVSGNIVTDRNVAPADVKDNGIGIRANMTHRVEEEMAWKHNYGKPDPEAPHGRYYNMPIIGRESRSVAGGVYGTVDSEFIIADDRSETTKATVGACMSLLARKIRDRRKVTPDKVLNIINNYTQDVLHYDLDATNRTSEKHYGNLGLIGLSEYIQKGVGVCRQQALLAALLMEAATKEGFLNGSIGVERNSDIAEDGSHAWAIYRQDRVNRDNDIIVDPAQNYVGMRAEARNDKRNRRWRYYLPVDE